MFTTPLLKPFDEPGNTLFNPNLRPPTVITAHGPDVGKTGFDITGLTRKKIADRLATQRLFYQLNESAEVDTDIVPHVVDPKWRIADVRIRRLAIKGLTWTGRTIQHLQHSIHDVIDVGEVTAMTTFVVQIDGSTIENRINEFPERHVRSSPRSIDGEEPQACGWNPVEMSIGVGKQFPRTLCRGVKRKRMVNRTIGSERQSLHRTVDT